jgi:hypothetical protein
MSIFCNRDHARRVIAHLERQQEERNAHAREVGRQRRAETIGLRPVAQALDVEQAECQADHDDAVRDRDWGVR